MFIIALGCSFSGVGAESKAETQRRSPFSGKHQVPKALASSSIAQAGSTDGRRLLPLPLVSNDALHCCDARQQMGCPATAGTPQGQPEVTEHSL